MQTVDDYKWTRLFRDTQTNERGKFYGLTFYRDEVSGKVAVRDMSGTLPHLTDDGVLWIDRDRPVVFDLVSYDGREFPNRAVARLPVICERNGSTSWTGMRIGDACNAVRELGLKIKVDGDLVKLMRTVMDIALLQIEVGK
jgi:hypothetical protein